jgi:hypothetical protein
MDPSSVQKPQRFSADAGGASSDGDLEPLTQAGGQSTRIERNDSPESEDWLALFYAETSETAEVHPAPAPALPAPVPGAAPVIVPPPMPRPIEAAPSVPATPVVSPAPPVASAPPVVPAAPVPLPSPPRATPAASAAPSSPASSLPSDNAAPAPAPATEAAASFTRVSLNELLNSSMQMHWFEVVAIAQGVCDALLRTAGSREPVAPPLQRLLLTTLGTVEITAGPAAGSAVALVRHILETRLPENKPVQLRLFLSELSTPQQIGTLKELTTALEYFERPDRSNVIRAVVTRYLAQQAAPPDPEKDERPEKEPTEESTFDGRLIREWLAAAAIVLTVAGSIGLATWWLMGRPAGPSGSAGGTRVTTMLTATRAAVVGGLQAIGERMGLVSPSTSPEPAADKKPVRDRRRASVAVAGPVADDGREAGGGGETDLPASPTDSGNPVVDASPEGGARIDAARIDGARADPVSDAAGAGFALLPVRPSTAGGGAVYDNRNADVTPPTELWPRFPEVPAQTVRADVAVFDLVINEAGQVESARVRLPLKRWDHVMLLSAMKTWRFQPATREGHPVKYRKEVTVKVSQFW